MAWLYDPNNRDEAVQILMKVSKIKQAEVEQAYDFLIKGKYFEPTGKVSRSKLSKLVDALKSWATCRRISRSSGCSCPA